MIYIVLYKNEIDYDIYTISGWLNALNSVLKGRRAECVDMSLLTKEK